MSGCEKKQQESNLAVSTTAEKETKTVQISKSSVYTTATNNNVKLQLTNANIAFSDFKQPLETEASIFVNTSKTLYLYIAYMNKLNVRRGIVR